MTNKRIPNYNDKADYNTNSPSYYHDLARKNKIIKLLAEKIWEYEEKLDTTLDDIENRIQQRFSEWDGRIESFPENVEMLLQDWLSDGTLDHIINDTIFSWKADQVDLDETNRQLAQTENDLRERGINIKQPPYNAPGVGESRPLSTRFTTLEDAKKVFKFATSLDDEIDTQALISAIDEASQGFSSVFIPSGEFMLDKKVIIKNWVDVVGAGRSSRLVATHDDVAIEIDKVWQGAQEQIGGQVSDFALTKLENDRTGTGIFMKDLVRGTIQRLYIKGFDKGIDTSGHAYVSSILNNHITDNNIGIYMFGSDINGNNAIDSGLDMNRRGLNGGTISENEINQNNFGIYFDDYINQSLLHNHGVSITNNAIQGNNDRGIRIGIGVTGLNITENYFEKNCRYDQYIDIENGDEVTDIKLARADILIDTHIRNNTNSAMSITIENNEVSDEALFVACGYVQGLSFTGNRLNRNGIFFFIPSDLGYNRSNDVIIGANKSLTASAKYFINEPFKMVSMQDNQELIKKSFFTTGHTMPNSESPEIDLETIPNNTHYFGRVSSKSGYPQTHGAIQGFKFTGNNYQYSWQEFTGLTATFTYRRVALNPETWSNWYALQDTKHDTRPSNAPVGAMFFDTDLNKPIWANGGGWVDATGASV